MTVKIRTGREIETTIGEETTEKRRRKGVGPGLEVKIRTATIGRRRKTTKGREAPATHPMISIRVRKSITQKWPE